ncbi:MAG: hypothetical protein IKV12_04045 [Alistipes sp.]|nr:hypothetical protein [Alistipes sp.]
MKITKHIFIQLSSILLAAGLIGCSVHEEGIYGSFPYLEIDETDISLSKLEGVVHIPYESNREVKVKCVSEWLTVSADQGEIVLQHKANDLEEAREATIEIAAPNSLVKKSITVIQDASGELTIKTDLILRSKEEILSNTYTKTTGALIIGNITSVKTRASDTYVTSDKTRAADSDVTVKNNNYTFMSSPTDINDTDIAPLNEQIHMISNGVLAILNTEVKGIPVNLIKSNKVDKVYFDYNAMTELPSKSEIDEMGLTELSISGNMVSDISVLKDNSTISYLDISGNDIYNLDALFAMPELKKVVLNDLPLTKPQAEIFKEQLSDCEVVLESFISEASPLPVFEDVKIEQISDTEVKLTATISKNNESIEEVGFYIGDKNRFADMELHSSTYSGGEFTLTYTTDELQNKIYYVRAYAKSSLGNGYSNVAYFGSRTSDEDIIIDSIDALNKFYEDGYSHINGSVLYGNIATSGANGIKLDYNGTTYTFVKSSDMSDLSAIKSLVYVQDGLYIGNVGVETIDAIANIEGIQTLWLKGNNISSIPTLKCNDTLTSLDVSINQLDSFDFLENMPSLKRLSLGAADAPEKETNNIGVLTGLEKYTNLEYIDLSGLPIHEWQVDELRSLMPATEIVFTSGGRTAYIPTVATKKMSRTDTSVTLTAVVTSKGNDEITEYGFYYGKDLSDMTQVKLGDNIEQGVIFSHTIDISDLDPYYYYPYAKNEYGESRCEASEFSLAYMDLSQGETANCYHIQTPGKYKFNATVRGNSLESVGEIASAEVVWEYRDNDDGQQIISEVNYDDGYVEFAIAGEATYGNALIAVKDANGKILWSWHIWLCDFDPEETAHKYKSGNTLMDRNLGATTATFNSNEEKRRAAGTLYQWGRKDPMTQGTITSTRGEYSTYAESFANPTEFVTGYWLASDITDKPETLWSSVQKTAYDPCPPGWAVAGRDSWQNVSAYIPNVDFGLMITYDGNNSVMYPFGYYYDSNFNYTESDHSYLWTSDYVGDSNCGWTFYYSSWSYGWEGSRYMTDAYSVRCMKDYGIVLTMTRDNIKAYSDRAVVNANVRSTQAAYITERGFVFSRDNSDPNLDNSTKVEAGAGEGKYTATLTDLKPNTTYWVRAYVKVEGTVKYGTVIEFTTAVNGSGDNFTEDDYEW